LGASPATASARALQRPGSGFPWFRYRSIPARIKNIFHGAKRVIIYKRWSKVPLALKNIFHGAKRVIIYKRWSKVTLALKNIFHGIEASHH
jgi:hypothetical protein